jgi:hypothetical protein
MFVVFKIWFALMQVGELKGVIEAQQGVEKFPKEGMSIVYKGQVRHFNAELASL